MARKLCTVCEIRTQYTGAAGGETAPRLSDMCNPCYAEGGWENTHSDGGHDQILAGTHTTDDAYTISDMEFCWICHPELNLAKVAPKAGHTNTAAKTRGSHAGHTHQVTPGARAMCRKSLAAGNGPWDGTH
jgi:hypothetical protein